MEPPPPPTEGIIDASDHSPVSPTPPPTPFNGYPPNPLSPPFSSGSSSGDEVGPHGALFLVLGYLRLPELLAFQGVSRLFRDAVASDGILWRHVAVEPPLSGRLTDDTLLRITSRAGGKLKSLALLDCWNISDAGLLRVVEQNSEITKLYIPGCTYLTADGVVRVVKRLTENTGNLKRIRLRGLCNITKEHLDTLNSFLCKNNYGKVLQPCFYNELCSLSLNSDDGRPIDVDMCPKCKNVRLVFDCTRENCRTMKHRWTECRGCFFCIARCEECGGCIDFEELGEETACSHLLCVQCWLGLSKCNMCNRPYCKRHASFQGMSLGSGGFLCEQCTEWVTPFYGPRSD